MQRLKPLIFLLLLAVGCKTPYDHPNGITIDGIAMFLGYALMVIASSYAVYISLALVAEAVISGEDRIFVALKVQPAIVRYFRNKKQIDALLEKKAGKP